MKTSHTLFNIDGTNYLIESNCIQSLWPCLVDKTIRYLERVGKKAAAEMCGHKAKAKCYTRINKRLVGFYLTINPQGLEIETK